ncbi:amidase [Rhizobium sp. BG4]|uniref:amidase n=1 Tax=Rhizobium sp. BG4 TaxID=2613770 RepID=UPI00193D5DDF|nr:amidase [Rhizobium sp. BG4]QRM45818.1 amidase [Rhizobium sp. BG4]
MAKTIDEMRSDFCSGLLLPSVAIETAIAAAQDCRSEINAFAEIDVAGARLSAAASDYRFRDRTARALEGIPVAVKDLVDTAGLATRYGSSAYSKNVPSVDAVMVRALKENGAAIVGKTTTHEFAWGVTTVSDHFGDTLNPWDHERTPGGSSGGMAAAIAYGAVSAGLGTDTGGSVRIPAALCGIVGFKPTYGMLSTKGVFPLAPSLDHVGIMGGCVGDVRTIASALGIACEDQPSVVRYRLGIVIEDEAPMSADVRHSFDLACATLKPCHDMTSVHGLPSFKRGFEAFGGIVLAEGGMVHFGRRDMEQIRASYGSETAGRLALAAQCTIGSYADSQRARREFVGQLEIAMQDFDFLLLPTCPCTAPGRRTETIEIGAWKGSIREALMTYTAPFNLAGLPALSLPILPGVTDGLPIGLQIVAGRGRDSELVAFAGQVERLLRGDATGVQSKYR